MKVYSDAIFNPLLNKNDFLQQAWRYEFKDNNDP